MKKAYLFPGQGSQAVGMGQSHYQANDRFRELVDHACEVLDFDIKKVMFEGPAEELKQTRNTQPAIFLHSVALFATLGQKPDMVAGHSLGEFSAMAAANAISFDDALRIVRKRGELMQQAGEDQPGTMAAIIGMEDETVEEVCKAAKNEIGKEVVPANYNSPGQLVISGDVEAVQKAVDLAKERGCKLAKLLPVSGAFHSALMESAYEGLKEELSNVEINQPDCPVFSNYTAVPTESPETLRENVLKQLLNPVRWRQTMENMFEAGATKYIEVGPGKVLQGLAKRTLKQIETEGYQ